MSDEKQYDHPYNDGYTHEVLHTAAILAEVFETFVVNTRCAAHFPDVKAKAEQIASELGELYQLVGGKFEGDDGDLGLISPTRMAQLFRGRKK